MRVRREIIRFIASALVCLTLVPFSADAAPDQSPLSSGSSQPACDLPFDAWSPLHSDRFLVLSDTEDFNFPVDEAFLEAFCRDFHRTFKKAGFRVKPLRKQLIWVCITDAQRYQDYSVAADGMDLSSLVSYYSAQTNRVAMHWIRSQDQSAPVRFASAESAMPAPPSHAADDFLRRITHELAHQLSFNYGIQKRGVLYPLWISEGLALNFEYGDTVEKYAQRNAERQRRLLQLVREDRLLPLDSLVVASRLPSTNEERCDLYAECWGFFAFLFRQYPVQFREYVEYLYGLQPGYRSPHELFSEFEYFFGRPDAYEPQWHNFLSELDRPAGQE